MSLQAKPYQDWWTGNKEVSMTDRAKVFAEAYGKLASPDSVTHIYDDGYVVAAPMEVDRQLMLLSHLKTLCPAVETARSPDGMFAVGRTVVQCARAAPCAARVPPKAR
jgi:hypothetical protein